MNARSGSLPRRPNRGMIAGEKSPSHLQNAPPKIDLCEYCPPRLQPAAGREQSGRAVDPPADCLRAIAEGGRRTDRRGPLDLARWEQGMREPAGVFVGRVKRFLDDSEELRSSSPGQANAELLFWSVVMPARLQAGKDSRQLSARQPPSSEQLPGPSRCPTGLDCPKRSTPSRQGLDSGCPPRSRHDSPVAAQRRPHPLSRSRGGRLCRTSNGVKPQATMIGIS
jgi:hypothetical protein